MLDWLSDFATRTIVAVQLAFGGAAGGAPDPVNGPVIRQPVAQEQQQTQPGQSPSSPFFVKVVPEEQPKTADPKEPCDNPPDREWGDLCQQWRMANAAISQLKLLAKQNDLADAQNSLLQEQNYLILFEGGLLALAFLASAFAAAATAAAVRVSRENAHMELRAFVSAGNFRFTYNRDTFFVIPSFDVTNQGKTPAMAVRHFSGSVVLPFEYPEEAPFPLPFDMRAVMDLGAGVSIVSPGSPQRGLNEEERNGIIARTHRIYVMGEINYRDVFGAHQDTRFCICLIDSAGLLAGQAGPRPEGIAFVGPHNRMSLNPVPVPPSFVRRAWDRMRGRGQRHAQRQA